MENSKIVYQCVRFSEEEANKVFRLVESKQPYLSCKKEELHATFKFYGFKKPAAFGDDQVFPLEWVKERKPVQFIVKQIATETEEDKEMIQGVFLEPHPSSSELVEAYYQNENPLHLTISFSEGVPPVRTGKIPEHFKEIITDENGEFLTITGFTDVFTAKGEFASK